MAAMRARILSTRCSAHVLSFCYLLKDVDGLYTADPKTNSDAIPEIDTAELIAQKLPTLPIEPVVLELVSRGPLARTFQIINSLVPGNLTRSLNGEPINTVIHGARRPA